MIDRYEEDMLGHELHAWCVDAQAEIDALRKDAERYRAALERIAALDAATDSEEGHNEWGEADCFCQARNLAREVLGAA